MPCCWMSLILCQIMQVAEDELNELLDANLSRKTNVLFGGNFLALLKAEMEIWQWPFRPDRMPIFAMDVPMELKD